MRRLVDRERLLRFMRKLGEQARVPARIYFTGGASAVLLEWRSSTIDVDLDLQPSSSDVLRLVPELKNALEINVELASPAHFIPELPGWEVRSPFISREGMINFHHYDFYAQALAKIERSHARDVSDVREMYQRGLITSQKLLDLFDAIEPELFRYPALDPASFRSAVETTVMELTGG